MVKFGCTTCWKTADDHAMKWWDDQPVCERCHDKYVRLSLKEVKNEKRI